MTERKIGRQTFAPAHGVVVVGHACAVGKKEGEGPLAASFDLIDGDDTFGQDTWEKSETEMQRRALTMALDKAGGEPPDLLFGGDLLNQCAASSFAARGRHEPFLGLYGACSTMGEGLILAAMALSGGFGRRAAVTVSSHFCTAERQYRNPPEYGGQRPPTAQWTVTGAGSVVLGREGAGPRVALCTPGRIVDLGVCDVNNMGAAMAPAAADTIAAHFRDTGRGPEDYDLVFTGDLGRLGSELLEELLARKGFSLGKRHRDCGMLIFDARAQDAHCGGSGCGCCAAVLTGRILNGLRAGEWRRVLFCPTGALHSPTTALQGRSIPGICHAVTLERWEEP